MPDSRIPLYLITGFLDSGKTTLLSDTLNMDYFNDGQRTVLLMCEDGEEAYDQQFLSQRNCRLIRLHVVQIHLKGGAIHHMNGLIETP